MNTQIKKIGNSKGIIIPAIILKMLDIKGNERLNIKVEENEIRISKVDVFDPKSLEELFSEYDGNYNGEIVFNDSKGREIW